MSSTPKADGPDLAGARWLRDPALQKVLAALSAGGATVRVVGGAVRDALMDREVGEVDLAIDVPPDRTRALAEAAGFKVVPTGIEHGTVSVVAKVGGHAKTFEVTTLRRDVETSGRHARVVFGADWAEDARRRDFTVNALYCDARGAVLDPLAGLGDIRRRRVRFIGDPGARIAEDYLRILRFFRLHAELGRGELDPDGLTACIALKSGVRALSGERIRRELFRLASASRAFHGLSRMVQGGILDEIAGGFDALDRLERYFDIAGATGQPRDPVLAFAALARDMAAALPGLGERLRSSRAERARWQSLVALQDAVTQQTGAGDVPALAYKHGRQALRDAVIMAWARGGAPLCGARINALLSDLRHWRAPRFPLSGRDIQDRGLREGPAIGALLGALEEDWIQSGFTLSRDALLERLRAMT